MPLKVANTFVAWQDAFGRHHNIAFWRAVPQASCGAFGGSGMLGVLRDVNCLSFKLNPFCFILYLIGVLFFLLFPFSLSYMCWNIVILFLSITFSHYLSKKKRSRTWFCD